jgi:hypothetical protein
MIFTRNGGNPAHLVQLTGEDLLKSHKQIVLELIFESQGFKFPADKIELGEIVAVDQRPEIPWDFNSTVRVVVKDEFFDQLNSPESALYYRRFDVAEHYGQPPPVIQPLSAPYSVFDYLPMINAGLSYPFAESDIINHVYERANKTLVLEAHPDSLIFSGQLRIHVDNSQLYLEDLMPVINVFQGFTAYS